MRSRCDALSWLTWASVQRRFLIGYSLLICFDLIEKRVERVRQVRVNVERQVRLRDLGGDPAPRRELVRLRIRLRDEHRIVQRPEDALAVEDLIEVVVALEQLHLRDARQQLVARCRRRRAR